MEFWSSNAIGKSNQWLYAANYYGEMITVDTSDPANLVNMGVLAIPGDGYPLNMEIYGDTIYLADYYVGIIAIDISVPQTPAIENTFGGTASAGLDLVGNKLYVTDYDTGDLTVYDVGADAYDPPVLGSINDSFGTWGIDVLVIGGLAYVAKYDYGIVVYDVRNPAAMAQAGELALYGVWKLETDSQYIYVVASDLLYVLSR